MTPMGQDVQHQTGPEAASLAGSRAFSDSLEDFSIHDPAMLAGVEQRDDEAGQEDETPVEEPVVTLHPDELEQLKQDAWQQGHEAGEQAAAQQLSGQMAEAVRQILAFMEEEENRRHDMATRMADLFVQGVCQTVEELVTGDLSRTKLGRHLAEDAAALIQRCEGPVKLTCSTADEAALREALAGLEGVSLHVEAEQQVGHLTIEAEETRIVLNQDEWATAVRQRVADAMQALTRSPIAEARPVASPFPDKEQTAEHEGE